MERELLSLDIDACSTLAHITNDLIQNTDSSPENIAGMAAAFLERPEDLKALIRNMDPEVRSLAQSFCPARSASLDE